MEFYDKAKKIDIVFAVHKYNMDKMSDFYQPLWNIKNKVNLLLIFGSSLEDPAISFFSF